MVCEYGPDGSKQYGSESQTSTHIANRQKYQSNKREKKNNKNAVEGRGQTVSQCLSAEFFFLYWLWLNRGVASTT